MLPVNLSMNIILTPQAESPCGEKKENPKHLRLCCCSFARIADHDELFQMLLLLTLTSSCLFSLHCLTPSWSIFTRYFPTGVP